LRRYAITKRGFLISWCEDKTKKVFYNVPGLKPCDGGTGDPAGTCMLRCWTVKGMLMVPTSVLPDLLGMPAGLNGCNSCGAVLLGLAAAPFFFVK
jgi:hypothetical protein